MSIKKVKYLLLICILFSFEGISQEAGNWKLAMHLSGDYRLVKSETNINDVKNQRILFQGRITAYRALKKNWDFGFRATLLNKQIKSDNEPEENTNDLILYGSLLARKSFPLFKTKIFMEFSGDAGMDLAESLFQQVFFEIGVAAGVSHPVGKRFSLEAKVDVPFLGNQLMDRYSLWIGFNYQL